MELVAPRFVEVYRAGNRLEAHSIRIALENAGIPVEIDGDHLQDVAGDVPVGWETAPRVMVAESQFARAREIISRSHARTSADADANESDEVIRCLACGHAMGTADKCSSCGWTYKDELKV